MSTQISPRSLLLALAALLGAAALGGVAWLVLDLGGEPDPAAEPVRAAAASPAAEQSADAPSPAASPTATTTVTPTDPVTEPAPSATPRPARSDAPLVTGVPLPEPSPTPSTTAEPSAPEADDPAAGTTRPGSDPPTGGGTTAPVTPEPTTGSGGGGSGSAVGEVLRLTNAERSAGGCAPLARDDRLARAAGGHSADMARTETMSHTGSDGSSPGDRISATGYSSAGWAENVAAGQPDARAVVAAWMGSPGHRANILNCALTEIGVGMVRGASGTPYWTQVFATPR